MSTDIAPDAARPDAPESGATGLVVELDRIFVWWSLERRHAWPTGVRLRITGRVRQTHKLMQVAGARGGDVMALMAQVAERIQMYTGPASD